MFTVRCEEVEKDKKETTGRLTVEEAISAAKIRHCPKCRKPFIKSDGWCVIVVSYCQLFLFQLRLTSIPFSLIRDSNKITCGCGSKSCYLCRSLISDPNPYMHFCQTPHCQHKDCNRCPLHTNDKEDDVRLMREAGVQAAEEVRNQSKQEVNASGSTSVDVSIDVDAILKQPH